MSSKYHISPQTGRPNLCRAETKSCPIGGIHYPSKEEAQEAYEGAMAGATVAPAVSKRGPYTSPFRPAQQVEGTTVWLYDDIMSSAGSKTKLAKLQPGIAFSESPEGLLMVRGKASIIEAYLQEPGGSKRDVAASLSGLRVALPRRVENVAPPTPPARAVKKLMENHPDEPDAVDIGDDFLGDSPVAEKDWAAMLDEDKSTSVDVAAETDKDWDEIKCESCGHTLSSCTCGTCEFCGGYEEDETPHYEDCVHYKVRPKAYSWE